MVHPDFGSELIMSTIYRVFTGSYRFAQTCASYRLQIYKLGRKWGNKNVLLELR